MTIEELEREAKAAGYFLTKKSETRNPYAPAGCTDPASFGGCGCHDGILGPPINDKCCVRCRP